MKYCVVKNCSSGLKNLKIKRSIFKVPKDVELRKKWEAAIPGITVLGDSSCICERHFKSDDIIRKRHFKSPTGEIIGVGVLERPRLSETAIPCFFDNESDQEILKNENSNTNLDSPEVMIHEETPDIKPISTNLDTPEVKINEETPDIKPMLNVWIDKNLLSEDKFDLSNVVVKSEPDPIASENVTNGSINEEFIIKDEYENASETTIDNNTSVNIAQGSIHEKCSIKNEDENAPETTNDSNSVKTKNIRVYTRKKQGSIHKKIIISNEDKNALKRTIKIDFNSKCITFSNNISSRNPILIPKSWSAINIPSENGEHFLFTHSILINKNGIEFPVTYRHVKLDTKKNLKYFIHGRPVDLTILNMSSSLFFNVEDISNILSYFESKNLCIGFNDTKNVFSNLNNEFNDCFGMWHSERCSLIAKLKQCSFCEKLGPTTYYKMKHCIVKNCKGSKNVKSFRVPKNIELRKKWEAAIPGITDLSSTSSVCERHFKSDDIIRKRYFKSPTGEILGVGILERPRLSETAIPCFFDNESDQELLKNENSNTSLDAAEVMIYEETSDIKPVNTNLDTPEVKIHEETSDIKPMLNVWIDKNLLSEDKFDLSNVVVKSEPDPIASENITQASIHEEFKIKDEDENTSDTTNDNNSVTSENFTQGSIDEEVRIKSEDKNDSKRTIDIDSDSKRITFSNNISSRNPILIPKSWGVINIPSEKGEHFLFTHSILINKNGIEFPFTCRHVKLNTNKNLKYFIHGRPVDLTVLNMSSSLFFNVEDISNILSVFQSKTLCSGFTLVNNDHCNLKREFIDCFGMWHSERCTLIAKLKRCSFCQTLRKTLLQKERRHNRAEPSSVNIFD